MKLSRTVAYALQATMQLAASESASPVPCSRIASQGDMPERFLLQVLRSLVNHGVLQSTRGVDGGYMLVKPAEEISLLEVIEAIEGPLDSKFPIPVTEESQSQGNLQRALQDVTQTARNQLKAIKIAQLIEPPALADEATSPQQISTSDYRQDSASHIAEELKGPISHTRAVEFGQTYPVNATQ